MNQPTTPDAAIPSQAADWLVSSQLWQVVALTPALGDLTIPVTGTLRIGRSDSNDVVLATPQVSRQHAQLTLDNHQLYVQDLGSANGTFVNGKRLSGEPTALQVGDELGFADLVFVIDTDISDDFEADKVLDNIVSALTHAHPTTTVGEAPTTEPASEGVTTQQIEAPVAKPTNNAPVSAPVSVPVSSNRVIETTTEGGASITASSHTVASEPMPTRQTYAAKDIANTSVTATPVAAEPVVTSPPSPMPSEAATHSVAPSASAPSTPNAAKKSNSALIAIIVIAIIAVMVASMLL